MDSLAFSPQTESYLKDCLESFLKKERIPIPPTDLDWKELTILLRQQRLAGLFASKGKQAKDIWPGPFTDDLRKMRFPAVLLGDAYLDEIEQVLAAFREEKIPVLILKGWSIIKALYEGDPSQRVTSDVDILVAPENLDRSIALLSRMGYVQNIEPHPGFYERYAIHLSFLSPKMLPGSTTRVLFELHWKMMHAPYFNKNINVADLFSRAHKIILKKEEVYVLSIEDHLVYFCGHMMQHGDDPSLVRVYELAGWILRYQHEINWDVVFDRAKAWRLSLALKYGIERVHALWPALLAKAIITRVGGIRPGLMERWIFNLEKEHTLLPHMVSMILSIPLIDKVRFLYEQLFPKPTYLKQKYGPAPFGFWPFLYFNHFGVGWRHILTVLAPNRKR